MARCVHEGAPQLGIVGALNARTGDVALCRQMNAAHIFTLKERRDALIEACMHCRDERVQAYAISLRSYLNMAQHNTADTGYNTAAYELLPMLRSTLKDVLSWQPDPFCREVEAAVRTAIGVALFFHRDLEGSAAEASKAVFWANQVGALFYVTRARTLLISVNAEMGQVGRAVALLEEENQNANRPPSAHRFQDRAYALMLYQLGQNEKALQVFRDALPLDKDDWRPVASDLQRHQALLGLGGTDGEIIRAYPEHAIEGYITASMRSLINAAAVPRTNQTLEKRQRFLMGAVDAWRNDRNEHQNWPTNLGRWVSGIAYLWQGKPSLALAAVQAARLDDTQFLDLRLLTAGLELEVALHLNHPELSPEHPLERLGKVFEQARNLPLGSPEGLAERLQHWHPLASAFASFAPEPIVELQTASRAVMRVGATNRVYDISLPPAYAAEQVLRALDYDLRPSVKFAQATLGSSRVKKDRLLTQYGEVKYWRPCLSAVSLIYGLKKLGQDSLAQAIYHEYGVAPFSSADYTMLPLVEYIRESTSKLLADKLSVQAFSDLLLNYD